MPSAGTGSSGLGSTDSQLLLRKIFPFPPFQRPERLFSHGPEGMDVKASSWGCRQLENHCQRAASPLPVWKCSHSPQSPSYSLSVCYHQPHSPAKPHLFTQNHHQNICSPPQLPMELGNAARELFSHQRVLEEINFGAHAAPPRGRDEGHSWTLHLPTTPVPRRVPSARLPLPTAAPGSGISSGQQGYK